MRYKISNWAEFQHYKDRCPPWIKLHHSLITSEVWVMGDDASRALFVACMLLASRDNSNDGSFNGDPEYIKRFAYLNSAPDFKHLLKHKFIELAQGASSMLAECNTEKRREEKRREDKTSSASEDAGIVYSPAFLTFWDMYPNKKNKGSAFKAFKKIKPAEYASVKEGLLSAIGSTAWLKDNGQFIPHPASWLNARGWEDDNQSLVNQPFSMDNFLKGVSQ